MAKRQPKTQVCSGCLEEFEVKKLYVVEKFINRTDLTNNTYHSPYCETCVKRTNEFYKINQKPTK